MTLERAIDLLTHTDASWRRHGRELATTIDGEITRGLFDRLRRGTRLMPPERGLTSELVEVLAASEHAVHRRSIEAIAPFVVEDEDSLARIVRGFPNLTELRLIVRARRALPDLSDTRIRRLWIACPGWTADEILLPPGLEALTLHGFGGYPDLRNADSIRELELGFPAQELLESFAPRLEKLHCRGAQPAVRVPRLRDLRCDYLGDPSAGAALEHIHVERASGREVLDHPDVGPDTRVRVDRWSDPVHTMRGDTRPYWIGPSGHAAFWRDLLRTFPGLKVVDLAQRHSEPPVPLPEGALPSPGTLWQREALRPSIMGSTHRRVVASWAGEGRNHSLQSAADRRQDKIRDIKHARALFQLGLRDAKVLVEALYEENFVALDPMEAATWQAWFRLVDCPTFTVRRPTPEA